LLVNKGANTELRDAAECTPLHLASKNGHKEATWLLVSKGAGKCAADNHKCTPLNLAKVGRHGEVVRMLQ
jgi:ankyrin repeat protein